MQNFRDNSHKSWMFLSMNMFIKYSTSWATNKLMLIVYLLCCIGYGFLQYRIIFKNLLPAYAFPKHALLLFYSILDWGICARTYILIRKGGLSLWWNEDIADLLNLHQVKYFVTVLLIFAVYVAGIVKWIFNLLQCNTKWQIISVLVVLTMLLNHIPNTGMLLIYCLNMEQQLDDANNLFARNIFGEEVDINFHYTKLYDSLQTLLTFNKWFVFYLAHLFLNGWFIMDDILTNKTNYLLSLLFDTIAFTISIFVLLSIGIKLTNCYEAKVDWCKQVGNNDEIVFFRVSLTAHPIAFQIFGKKVQFESLVWPIASFVLPRLAVYLYSCL